MAALGGAVSGYFYIDWGTMAASLFNVMLLLWLALTVVLNAERRNWGVLLAGCGLGMGSAFFISHTAILAQSLTPDTPGVNFWWQIGWVPVILLPYAWYVVVLWYTGFWEPGSALGRRQRPGFWVLSLGTIALAVLLAFFNPLPSFSQVIRLDLSSVIQLGGEPALLLLYPAYILICILLALDALLRPGPTARLMGDEARRRARPWLLGSTLVLLTVSVLVTWALYWLIGQAHRVISYETYFGLIRTLAILDFLITSLISGAVLLLGQAVVSYEVFTGKALPRQGLARHWRNAVILFVGISVTVGWTLTIHLKPTYSLLLTVLLLTVFYALLTWRVYIERERTIRQLRPFVSSPRLYDRLLARTPAPPDVKVDEPFQALCRDVLGVRRAVLVALSPLAPLVGAPLVYPPQEVAPLLYTNELVRQVTPHTMSIALDPAQYAGMTWAVPLWSDQGLVGLLLLAGKNDGGFYTQEEIEIARASGERLVDTLASAEIARRLMALQRQRMSESQLLDRRTRRVLHDDVLPEVHAAMLTLSAQPGLTPEACGAIDHLALVHRQISNLLHDLPNATTPEATRLGLLEALRQVIDEELRGAFDQVDWQVEPAAQELARSLPPVTTEVLFYAGREAIRNAAHHARPPDDRRPLRLALRALRREGLVIEIEDDGVGLESAAPAPSGSGQGLALHGTLMAVIGGSLGLESVPGRFTRVTLTLRQP